MGDRKPSYSVERMRLELQLEEHDDTIFKGKQRINEIDRQQKRNLQRAAVTNADLEVEKGKILENEEALGKAKAEITKNLELMVTE